MIIKELCTIIDHEEIADNIYKLTVKGSITEQIKRPGQFVHIKVGDGIYPLLRRPISISEFNKESESFTMIYRQGGHGTKLLAKKLKGEMIDILGPLGNGFPLDTTRQGETALLVGGGIGVPPLYELSKQLVAKGVKVTHVLGFQTEKAVFLEKEFLTLGETYVATVDGSYGESGFVTDVIKEKNLAYDVLFTCGPTPMLKAIQESAISDRVYLSLEERMGCGIGACFACVCPTGDQSNGATYKKVCSDGPVFKVGEVRL